VDTEADSLHSYKEKLCLIQFTCAERHVIIDPLRVENLSPLLDFLREAEVWMHGADFDMSLFKRTFDFVPPTVLDTQTAARLVGFRQFGLAHLLQEVFSVTLSKQSQRADWGRRPLPPVMVEYAINDVRYILPLADRLLGQLGKRGVSTGFTKAAPPPAPTCSIARLPMERKRGASTAGATCSRADWPSCGHSGTGATAKPNAWTAPPSRCSTTSRSCRWPWLPEWRRAAVAAPLPAAGPPAVPSGDRRSRQAAARTMAETPAAQTHQPPPGGRKTLRPPQGYRDRLADAMNLDGSLIASRAVLEEIAQNIETHQQLLPWQQELLLPAVEALRASGVPAGNGPSPE
jgi:ribonuclease D